MKNNTGDENKTLKNVRPLFFLQLMQT